MGVISARLPDDTHDRWKAYCANFGLKPSDAIKHLIEDQLQAQLAPMKPTGAGAGAGGKNKIQVKVQITESEREGIRLRTHLHGSTRSGWIAKAIRSALTLAPIIGEEQTEILKASNHQLLKIGININQIARRLNEHQEAQSKAIEVEELREIRKQINEHVLKVEALISTVNGRGQLEDG